MQFFEIMNKKIFIIVKISLFLMLGILYISGCSKSSDEVSSELKGSVDQVKQEQKIIKIGLSLPTLREERWKKDKEVIESEAAKAGIEIISYTADNDEAEQEKQCETMFGQGISVLILTPHNADSAADIVFKAQQKGIKVISYDRLILNADIDFYVSFDNVKVGELQGKYLTEKVPKGNYAVLSGAPTDNNCKMYKEGAMKYILPNIEKKMINVVLEKDIEDWNPEEAKKIIKTFLKSNKIKIDALLAPNDLTAGACIEALAEKKLDGKIPVTGQDAELAAVKRILTGKQSMTVFKDTRILAAKSVELAKKISSREQI